MQLSADSSTRPRDAQSKAGANAEEGANAEGAKATAAPPATRPREKSAGDAMTRWEDA